VPVRANPLAGLMNWMSRGAGSTPLSPQQQQQQQQRGRSTGLEQAAGDEGNGSGSDGGSSGSDGGSSDVDSESDDWEPGARKRGASRQLLLQQCPHLPR
jgi:hypothetical protein